jgi:1-acyl-sn-glycerol-3-phosphate acyltransferase
MDAFAAVRAICFYLTTFVFATPLFCFMLLAYPFVMLFDKYRRRAEHIINTLWAKLTTLFYYPVTIHGLENLPASDQPAVFVANHESFLDIYTLFHLQRDFKFISKTSNFFIPIIGWSMFLTGHVMINRVDRKSQIACLKECGNLLLNKASVLFFPEGTRTKDGKMHAFKKGAFSVAAKAKVPVVPITLKGSGSLMPNKKEYLLYPGKVEVVIHPSVQPSDADTMMKEAFEAVASSLPPEKIADDARDSL